MGRDVSVSFAFSRAGKRRRDASGALRRAVPGRFASHLRAPRAHVQPDEGDPMTTILRVDASSRAAGSVSRALGDHFERAWLDRNPGDRVIHRDVATEPIGHIAEETIAGFYAPADRFTDELRAATVLSDRLIAEVQSADVLL